MKRNQCFVALVLGAGLTWALLWLLVGQPVAVHADLPTRFVATDGDDAYDCSSIVQRCRTVQRAIDAADAFDEIWVTTGTYTDPAGTVADIDKTVTLLGGWNGGFTARNPDIYPTVLDAERNGRVVYIFGDISPTVDGFTITGGDATSTTDYAAYGGGIYSRNADPIITNNVITGNVASDSSEARGRGGGLYLRNSSSLALVSGNQVLSNTASTRYYGYGGGLFLDFSAASVGDNIVQGNIASTADQGSGGGIYLTNSAATLRGNTISDNMATITETGQGGGLVLYYSFGALQDGVAAIVIDPIFAQTVNLQEPYHVFVQVYGNAEVYVSNRTPTGFEVHLRDGEPDVEFSYRIVGKRLGYEDHRLELSPGDGDANLHQGQE